VAECVYCAVRTGYLCIVLINVLQSGFCGNAGLGKGVSGVPSDENSRWQKSFIGGTESFYVK